MSKTWGKRKRDGQAYQKGPSGPIPIVGGSYDVVVPPTQAQSEPKGMIAEERAWRTQHYKERMPKLKTRLPTTEKLHSGEIVTVVFNTPEEKYGAKYNLETVIMAQTIRKRKSSAGNPTVEYKVVRVTDHEVIRVDGKEQLGYRIDYGGYTDYDRKNSYKVLVEGLRYGPGTGIGRISAKDKHSALRIANVLMKESHYSEG